MLLLLLLPTNAFHPPQRDHTHSQSNSVIFIISISIHRSNVPPSSYPFLSVRCVCMWCLFASPPLHPPPSPLIITYYIFIIIIAGVRSLSLNNTFPLSLLSEKTKSKERKKGVARRPCAHPFLSLPRPSPSTFSSSPFHRPLILSSNSPPPPSSSIPIHPSIHSSPPPPLHRRRFPGIVQPLRAVHSGKVLRVFSFPFFACPCCKCPCLSIWELCHRYTHTPNSIFIIYLFVKFCVFKMMKPVHSLVVRSWKENEVQLVQFPRFHTVPSASPFALKLETFLRMNNIKYHNVSNEFSKASPKGQIPFIELNGQQFSDSNFCIEKLRTHFNLPIDAQLTTAERAHMRAFSMLIEESLFRCLQYDRSKDFGWMATDKGVLLHLSGVQKFVFQKLLIKQIQSRIKKNVHAQGYGRHTQEEIEEIAKKDLMSISTLLGDKPFLFGETPTTLDATLFGHLVQFTDTPLKMDSLKAFIDTSTPNLAAFVKRMKERYWPDWAQIIEHLALNPEDLEKPKETTAAEAAGENGTNGTEQPKVVATPVPEAVTAPAQEGLAVQAQA